MTMMSDRSDSLGYLAPLIEGIAEVVAVCVFDGFIKPFQFDEEKRQAIDEADEIGSERCAPQNIQTPPRRAA